MIVTMLAFDLHIDLRKFLIDISTSIIVIDSLIIIIDLCLKHIMLNEIIIYEKFEVVDFLANLFGEY